MGTVNALLGMPETQTADATRFSAHLEKSMT